MMYFTKKQFVVRLYIPIPSFFKQFLYFTQILTVFLHPNVIRVLMGYSVLDMLFQLDLSLLELLFVYTVKMSKKERFILFAHIPSLQLVTDLLDSCKGWAKGHVLVSGLGVVRPRDQKKPFLHNVCWGFRVGYASITFFVSCNFSFLL